MFVIIALIVCFFPALSLAETISFGPYQKILDDYLQETQLTGGGLESAFNYRAAYMSKNIAGLIDRQKALIEQFDSSRLKTKGEALSFWINAYNFLIINEILSNGFDQGKLKIKSVKDLGSFFNRYKVFQKKMVVIGGQDMSLDDIEKKTLLGDDYAKKGWKDPRIHFAVNCASVGCPPLRKNAYSFDKIDTELDENIKKSLKNKRHFYFSGNNLYLTELFKWYRKDFEQHSGEVRKFIAQYLNDEVIKKKVLATKPSDIYYIPYDWNLNLLENFEK